MAFADLKNDFVFRRIFATHPEILRGLLNDLLDRSGEEAIVSLEYLPSERLPLVICDFDLWPDAEQTDRKLPLVPMLSSWNMTERGSGNHGLLQVQYAFLELPKLPASKPDTGASQWAWLFVHAPGLTDVPPDLPEGPYRQALELANKATFTLEELDAYQKVNDEIEQVRELVESKRIEGEITGLARAILAFLAARGIVVSAGARAHIEACKDIATLERWIVRATTAKSAEEIIA